MNNALQHKPAARCIPTALWYWLAAVPALFYAVFLWRHTANTPFHDDYYDILVPLLLYRDSDSASGALRGLFWQYHQHFVLYDRLVYWITHTLTGGINFRTLVFVGNLGLLAYFLLLASQVRREQLYVLPCASAVFFNLFFEENAFWAMAAVQQLTIMAFSLAALLLLDRGTVRSTMAASFFCWLAVFTQSNEVLLVVLGLLLLLDNTWRQRLPLANPPLLIWCASSALCLVVFFSQQNVSAVDRFFAATSTYQAANPVHDVITNFLASLAGLPFAQGSNPHWAAPLGAVQLLLAAFLAWRGWQHQRALTLMLLFCILSLLAVSIMRTPHVGPTAYVSRYKLFSTSILCIGMLLAVRIFPGRRWVPAMAAFAVLAGGYSYWMNGSYVASYRLYREQVMMTWLATTRVSAFPLASAILDEAYATGIYQPLRDIPHYPALPQAIEPADDCPATTGSTGLPLQLASEPGSRAALLSARSQALQQLAPQPPSAMTLWLCGNAQNYRVRLQPAVAGKRQWTELVIVEKQRVAPGDYSLRLEHQSGTVLDTGLRVDMRFTPQRPADCLSFGEALRTLVPVLHARYCAGSSP